MKKVFQKVVDKGKGDCMRAATASLFEVELDEVPDFKAFGERWFSEMYDYYKLHGYDLCPFSPIQNMDLKVVKEALKHDGGVNGFFEATVLSQTFNDGTTHSVIVNSDLEIVHDPNPNQRALKLKPQDVLAVTVVNTNSWHIDLNGNLIKEP